MSKILLLLAVLSSILFVLFLPIAGVFGYNITNNDLAFAILGVGIIIINKVHDTGMFFIK